MAAHWENVLAAGTNVARPGRLDERNFDQPFYITSVRGSFPSWNRLTDLTRCGVWPAGREFRDPEPQRHRLLRDDLQPLSPRRSRRPVRPRRHGVPGVPARHGPARIGDGQVGGSLHGFGTFMGAVVRDGFVLDGAHLLKLPGEAIRDAAVHYAVDLSAFYCGRPTQHRRWPEAFIPSPMCRARRRSANRRRPDP